MNKNYLTYCILLLLTFLIISCANDKKDKKLDKNEQIVYKKAPDFNKDSAYKFLQEQLNFGPRVLGSQAWAKCAVYFEQKLKVWADTVIIQTAPVRTFNNKVFTAKNIIASFNTDNSNRILLAAHWDSRPFADKDPNPENYNKPIDGANDGASGVAVLMEIARIMKNEKPNIGVDIILFDAEDYGATDESKKTIPNPDYTWGLGSQYWAKNPHKANYKANFGILLDMVGTYNPNFTKEGFSVKYAPDFLNKVWNLAAHLGYSSIFTDRRTGYIMDDHYFVNEYAGIPMINIIHHDPTTSSGFFPYWHTINDNIGNIDINTLNVVGNTVLNVIWNEH